MSGRSGWSVLEFRGKRDRQPAAGVRTSEGKVRRRPASFLAGVPHFEDGEYLVPPGHRNRAAGIQNHDRPGVRRRDLLDQVVLILG